MKWIVKNDSGVLEFKSIQVCTESQFNKIMANINHQRILSWCDDNHVLAEVQKGEQCMSILREVITEVTESEARRMDRLHLEFLKFVDSLPNVDTVEDKKELGEQTIEKFINTAKNIISGIDEGDVNGAILITQVGDIGLPCGQISPSILRELFELYINKYEHKDN